MTESTNLVWALALLIASWLAFFTAASALAAPPGPNPYGKPNVVVRPTVAYGFPWFANDGTAGQLRIHLKGRRYTPRSFGAMGVGDYAPVSEYLMCSGVRCGGGDPICGPLMNNQVVWRYGAGGWGWYVCWYFPPWAWWPL